MKAMYLYLFLRANLEDQTASVFIETRCSPSVSTAGEQFAYLKPETTAQERAKSNFRDWTGLDSSLLWDSLSGVPSAVTRKAKAPARALLGTSTSTR